MNRTTIGSLAVGCVIAVSACHSERAVESNPGTLTIVSGGDPATWDTVIVGDFIWFTVMRRDSTVPAGPWEWTVSDLSVLSIQSQITYEIWLRGERPGRATVTVKFNGEFGTHDVVVRALRPADTAVAHIEIPLGDEYSAQVGDSVPFGFNLYDARGNSLFNRAFTLTLSDSTILRRLPSDEGPHGSMFRAVKMGSTFIKVVCGTQQDSMLVVVK